MAEKLDKYTLNNGLVLLGEPLRQVASVAFGFMIPSGVARLPEGCCGCCNVISDWIFRGAGNKNSRQLSDALDSLGLHRAGSVNSSHISIGAALEASNLSQALDLYADIILRHSLLPDQFQLAKQLAIDAVRALDDDPRQKVMLKLREQFYPNPLGRSTAGDIDQLKSLTAQKTKKIITHNFNLSHTIFCVAGKYDFDIVVEQMKNLFETDNQLPVKQIHTGEKTGNYTHIENEGAQVHIGLMTKTVTLADKDYYNARVAVSVLSGGMSARLFTEVREKRGLCYAIGARYHGLKEAAGIMCYAGTTPDKAQETLDVIKDEFKRLSHDISEDEIQRAKVGLKASLILSSESTSSRAAGIATDYYMLGKVRTLDEIKDNIEQTTVDSVLDYLRRNIFEDFTVVTVGPKKVKV